MNRYTFVVQVHPQGISTVENLSTHERVSLPELSAVGPQIERWLTDASGGLTQRTGRSETDRSGSTGE